MRPVVERVGRSLTTATARLEQDGKLIALGVAALSVAVAGPVALGGADAGGRAARRAQRRSAAACPARSEPPFMGRAHDADGASAIPPSASSEHALTGGWLGLLEERPVDALTLLVLADAWYPAPWPRLKRSRRRPRSRWA